MDYILNEKHNEDDDDCNCLKCLEDDYNDPNGSWFPESKDEDKDTIA